MPRPDKPHGFTRGAASTIASRFSTLLPAPQPRLGPRPGLSPRRGQRSWLGWIAGLLALLTIVLPDGIGATPAALAADPFSASYVGGRNSGKDQGKTIALTFDDGLSAPNTSRILDTLEREHVRATFFPAGSWAQQEPAILARMAAQHEVGNHTFSHPHLPKLDDASIRREILGGTGVRLLRPPYGDVNDRVRAIAAELGYQVILWDVDSRDWTGISAATITANVVSNAADGRIVLMHMGLRTTGDALPGIIAQLRRQGYGFASVSDLDVGSRPGRSVLDRRGRRLSVGWPAI